MKSMKFFLLVLSCCIQLDALAQDSIKNTTRSSQMSCTLLPALNNTDSSMGGSIRQLWAVGRLVQQDYKKGQLRYFSFGLLPVPGTTIAQVRKQYGILVVNTNCVPGTDMVYYNRLVALLFQEKYKISLSSVLERNH